MQLMVSFRNVAITTAVVVAGYYGYKSFYGDIQSQDIPQLLQSHRLASSLKRQVIRARISKLYQPGKDYGTLEEALGHSSSVTQVLAIDILTEKQERRAVPKLLEMLNDPRRKPEVKAWLAKAFKVFPRKAAIARLIAFTDETEERQVRVAAHNTLKEVLSTGAQIKFGEAMHEHWTEWWRDHKVGVKLP